MSSIRLHEGIVGCFFQAFMSHTLTSHFAAGVTDTPGGYCSIANHLRSADNFNRPIVNSPRVNLVWIPPSKTSRKSTAPSLS
ncbi:MAG: hypothetical protein QF805_30490, partial [Pirellulaceae bacterium]|nr:hypothetical protein [Pirellulaceae bacterium]